MKRMSRCWKVTGVTVKGSPHMPEHTELGNYDISILKERLEALLKVIRADFSYFNIREIELVVTDESDLVQQFESVMRHKQKELDIMKDLLYKVLRESANRALFTRCSGACPVCGGQVIKTDGAEYDREGEVDQVVSARCQKCGAEW